MAKTYQEKMYEDYKRTHPTWRRDIKTHEKAAPDTYTPKKKAAPDTYTPQKRTVEWKAPGGNKPTEKRVLNTSRPKQKDTYPTQKGTASASNGSGSSRWDAYEKKKRTGEMMRRLTTRYGK